MSSKADRLKRVARVRALQKRHALAQEAGALGQVSQLRDMAERIEMLRRAHAPSISAGDSFALKSLVHQYDRLGNALLTTQERTSSAEAFLHAQRARTLAAHQRKRAADELADRAVRNAEIEAERRRERNAPPRKRLA